MMIGGEAAATRSCRLVTQLLLVAAVSLAAPRAAQPQTASGITDLDWLAGGWVMQPDSGERLEERWSSPAGNSMVGWFRWIRGGELWMTELMTITEEAGDVVFRLRHFSAELTPWEAPDDALVYRLTERGQGRAAFTILEPRPGRPERFVFEALPGDSLLVRLEGEEDGRPSIQDFRYARARRGHSP